MDELGFNPCFIGRTTLTSSSLYLNSFRSMFQSLFYWKNHFNARSRMIDSAVFLFQSLFYWKNHFNGRKCWFPKKALISFNPCFIGRTTLTIVSVQSVINSPFSFNPCFIGRTTLTIPPPSS